MQVHFVIASYASGPYSADLGEILGLALDLRFSVLRR